MAALRLDASLETLRPLCYRGTQRLHGDLCRCFHNGSLETLQVVVPLLASHVLQNSPQFIVQGLRSGLPEGQSSALINAETCLRSYSWVVLALWAGVEFCWKTHFWPLKTIVLRGFTTPCSKSSWYIRAPVFTPFLQKWRYVNPWWDTPPQNHDVGRVVTSLHTWNLLLRLTGTLGIHLVVLAVVLLLDGEDFLVHEEDVFVPVLGVPLEEELCSCLSDLLQSGSKEVSLRPPVGCHV